MAYTVLARRYRSATFDEVIGQDHVAHTLKKAIESGRIAHAYLFNGTRGVGKTSMARILAKALNCRKADGPTAEPCLKCDSCLAIARGDDMDVIEIDAASNTGVDDVRDLISNAQFCPARSRFKVYIIDEVHMLSKSAFNALLKTLEEPPSHVKFILATTEPEKVPPTIHSRCQRYDFRNIPTREIAGHLRNICKQEKISADEDALILVAKCGAGSMRDSLSLLDRLLSIGEKNLSVDGIEEMLGLPKSQAVFQLVQAMGQGDVKATLSLADRLITEGLAPDSLVASLIDHLRNLLVINACGPDSSLVEAASLTLEELAKQAKEFDAATLTQDITILEDLRRQMRLSSAGRAILDATLVRLALSEQFTSIAELLGRADNAGSAQTGVVQKKKIELVEEAAPLAAMPVIPMIPAATTIAAGDGSTLTPALPETVTPSQQESVGESIDDLPAVGRVWEGEKKSLSAMFKSRAAANSSSVASPIAPPAGPVESVERQPEPDITPADPSDLPAVWRHVLGKLQQNHGLFGTLSAARLSEINNENVAVVLLGPQHATFRPNFAKNGRRDLVAGAITSVLSRPVGVRFEVATAAIEPTVAGDVTKATSNPATARANGEGAAVSSHGAQQMTSPLNTRPTLEQIREFENDPLVAALMEKFGAEIVRIEE